MVCCYHCYRSCSYCVMCITYLMGSGLTGRKNHGRLYFEKQKKNNLAVALSLIIQMNIHVP